MLSKRCYNKNSYQMGNRWREKMNNKLRFLDLFAGIGGFRSGMEKEGHECVGYVEWDKHARKSYENMYDTKGEWTRNDITEITNDEWKELRGKVDVICGGFPCQAFSVAGKRGGFSDTRGTLFFEIARALKEIQPSYVLLENVKGLLSHDKGKTLDTIIKTLNDIGYRVDFEVLNSKLFGVPQNRERIFIVAVREDLVDNEAWTNVKGATVVPKGKRRIGEWAKTFNFDFPEQKEVTTRLRDILESSVDEKYYLDEEKTAKLVAKLDEENRKKFIEVSSKRIVQLNGDRDNPGLSTNEDEAYTIPANPMSDRGQLLQEPQMLGHVDLKGNDSIKRTYSTDGIAPTLNSMQGGGREPKIAIKEATKKGYTLATVGDSVNYTYPDSKTRRGRVGKGVAQTLQAGEVNQGTITSDMRIRKLTPKECFRLQGFTDEQFYKAEEVNLNSQLYKQAGNSVTVNVIQAIAERL